MGLINGWLVGWLTHPYKLAEQAARAGSPLSQINMRSHLGQYFHSVPFPSAHSGFGPPSVWVLQDVGSPPRLTVAYSLKRSLVCSSGETPYIRTFPFQTELHEESCTFRKEALLRL